MKKKLFATFGLLLTIFLIGFYIFQLNALTTLAWHIADTEQQLSQFKYRVASLETQAYQALPLENLEQIAHLKNFERVTFITYIQQPSGIVAQNQPR